MFLVYFHCYCLILRRLNVNIGCLSLFLLFIYIFSPMKLETLYSRAKKRHGQLNRDVVHDLFLKFGVDLPSDAYLTTCMKHCKPEPIQQRVDVLALQDEEKTDTDIQSQSYILSKAMEVVRNKYELELDTFLECCVNSTYKDFSEYSGISITVLRKICNFAKTQIKNEYRNFEKSL